MKIVMTTIAAIALAGSVSAAELGGSVGVEVTENNAGDYVAETTLGLGVSAETGVGLAFGGFSFESVDGGNLAVDEWQLGINIGQVTASIGEQGDIFVAGRMETVGEDTLALPENDTVESVIVQWDGAVAFVGFEDLSAGTDVRNVQLAYNNAIGHLSYTGAIDYNNNTHETTLGLAADYMLNADADVGVVATYAVDAEAFGYEAYGSYKFATVFVNGSNGDALENIGAGVNHDFDNLNVYAEASYNLDAKDTVLGAGVAFKF